MGFYDLFLSVAFFGQLIGGVVQTGLHARWVVLFRTSWRRVMHVFAREDSHEQSSCHQILIPRFFFSHHVTDREKNMSRIENRLI